ncbi:MAG: hypothetical protein PHS49_07780 [Candidatus Gracilibacteria bacterium]|nr:hypothetical protein [Candidatus Gracilibacteria bacterium]
MKTLDNEKIVKIPSIMDREYSYKEICDMLDYEEARYLSGEGKSYTLEEVWDNVKNRKNTFLTQK